MRHCKDTEKLGRTGSHKRAMIANLIKSLIMHDRIVTTTGKGKALRRYADQIVTMAKQNSLASRRRVIAELQIRFNRLTPKERRAVKEGDKSSYNLDRQVVSKLFSTVGPRFATRPGGYTRVVRHTARAGDNAERCVVELVSE